MSAKMVFRMVFALSTFTIVCASTLYQWIRGKLGLGQKGFFHGELRVCSPGHVLTYHLSSLLVLLTSVVMYAC